MVKPLIGITLDHEEPGGYAQSPWYALRQNYSDAVAKHGGIPFMLPYHPDLAEHYLGMIQGLVITGGNFDIDPSIFGDSSKHATVTTKPARTQFESAMLQGALERNLPILGICGGEQLLNVALGGTLIQHIPDSIPGCLEHEQKTPKHLPSHSVTVEAGTLLHRITGKSEFMVNSTHHQAVRAPGKGAVINCRAPDTVIEGIEAPDYTFCLGVQWHPEYLATAEDNAIFAAFLEACKQSSHAKAA
jgi:putative glutamine amidotransferase